MKHIKLFEELSKKEEEYNNIALYLEEIQPVSEKDGFIECLYGYETGPVELCFYFKSWTDEDDYEKFNDFLEEKGLQVFDERTITVSNFHTKYEIIVRPNRRQLRKLKEEAELWDTANKYNL